jgi:hypothetical protein
MAPQPIATPCAFRASAHTARADCRSAILKERLPLLPVICASTEESFSISACESADNGSAFSIWIISSSYGLLLPCRHA